MGKNGISAGYRKRNDGKYESRFTIDGRRYSVYADTIKECKEKDAKLREQIINGLYVDNRNITLDQYYAEWKESRKGTIKGNTALGTESRYKNHIKPALGDRKITNIEKREIVKLQDNLSKTQKASSANAIMVQLKSILNDAVRDDIIARNPAEGIKMLKDVGKTAAETCHRALTEEEQKIFMDEAKKEWLYQLIAFLICTGMRVGEATALTWQDIDYKNNVVHITKTVSRTVEGKYTLGTPKNKSSIRNIPMNENIKIILKSQKEKQTLVHGNIMAITQNVFENVYGGNVFNASVNKAIVHTLERIKQQGTLIEHFSAHALRDTFATRYIEQGGSPQVLKTILGHSSLAMTMDLYSHVLPNTKQKEMNNITIAL